ncbi:hypothetical protein [Kineococcus terrestris]|uniref:hypothetical protein n=1 Tax=Kineococcus terrestris TaxID=2044856 RepID=UPI0034DAF61B
MNLSSSTRQFLGGLFLGKAVAGFLVTLGWVFFEPDSWAANTRVGWLVFIVAVLCAVIGVWLQVARSRDAWRAGYRAGLEEARTRHRP